MVVCKPYTVAMQEAWDNFIDQSKLPLFFFKRPYLEYHSDRFVDSSLMFYVDDTLVALLPASKHESTMISHGGLTYGGLLVSHKARAEIVIELVGCLAKTAWELGYKKIIYKSAPYIFYTQPNQEDLYSIVNGLNAKLFRRDLSSVIYLNNRIRLSKGRKWCIAKAKKMNLEVTDSTAWEAFHALLSKVLARHGKIPIHSVDELKYLSSLFPKHFILKTVEKNGCLLAAVLLFKFNNTVHTQYLASSEEGKELGSLDFLIESCIESSKKEGMNYFSFGISTEEQGKILNNGLIAQKENFGARGLVIDFYEIELNDRFS